MKHVAIGLSSVALLVVLLYGAWVRADTESRERGAFAEEMTQGSEEETIFYASGPLNKQLTIIPEFAEFGPSGQAECDSLVDSLIHDKKAMSEIQQKGFTSLRCGEREVRSWQAKF